MPVKENSGAMVLVCGKGSPSVMLKDIPDIQFETGHLDNEMTKVTDTIYASLDIVSALRNFGIEIISVRTLCNNWRKLHGLTMRRRKGVSSRISRTE